MYCCVSCSAGPPALTVNIVKSSKDSSIVVQWDKVDDFVPTTYIMTWTDENGHVVESFGLVEWSSYTITGLTLDTVYTITVAGSNICGNGPEYRTNISLSAGNVTVITNITPTVNSMTIMSITGPSTTTTTTVTNSSTATITTIIQHNTISVSNTVITTALTSHSTSTVTNIIMSSTSTANPADATTPDESSKL